MESHRSYGLKKQDAFSEIVIVDPITLPIARVLATLKVHPITVTIFAFLARLIAAGFFIYGFGAYGALEFYDASGKRLCFAQTEAAAPHVGE